MIPVFIGGCQRSGTTLLASILSGSDKVLAIPEAPFKFEIIKEFEKKSAPEAVSNAAKLLDNENRFKIWNSELPDNNKIDSFNSYFEMIIKNYKSSINDNNRIDFWIDHTPENLKFVHMLSQQYSNAKFIHIIRDGRANSASILPLDWGPNEISECSIWWTNSICHGLAAEKFLKDKIITVFYEDLLSNPTKEIKRICLFLGTEFSKKMLLGKGFTLPKYTEKQHNKVGKGFDMKRANAWQKNLTPYQINEFQNKTGDILKLLGYEFYSFENDKVIMPSKISKVYNKLYANYKRYILNPRKQRKRFKKNILSKNSL